MAITSQAALWMGANMIDGNSGWQWSDGSPFTYINWQGGMSIRFKKKCRRLFMGGVGLDSISSTLFFHLQENPITGVGTNGVWSFTQV